MAGILKISEGSNLAVHALAFMGSSKEQKSVSVGIIAENLGVSRDHLGKVLQRLSRLGMVNSRRGPRGGFVLARAPNELTLLEIVEAIDGPLTATSCMLGTPVCGGGDCVLGNMMRNVYEQVIDVLAKTRLSDLPSFQVD